MTTKDYQLFGFTAAKGKPPQFIEPIFIRGNSLFVQSGLTSDEKIEGFNEFTEGVDLIEQRSEEIVTKGDACIFAVMERGGRLIYGDRPYVSRYLSQNLRSYMDSPYFLKDCIEFTGKPIPEFSIIENNSDLLELSVAVNSINEFIKTTPSARDRILIEFKESKSIEPRHIWNLEPEPSAKTLFGEWLLFAESKNHRVAKSHRWKNIEKSYLRCYEDNDELLTYSARHHFDACRNIISFSDMSGTKLDSDLAEISDLATLVLNFEISRHEPDELEPYSVTRELQLFHGRPTSRARDNITDQFSSWIRSAISAQTISYFEIIVQVYFLTIAVKTAFLSGKDSEDD